VSFHLLDTNICIEIIRQRSTAAIAELRRYRLDEVGISSITFAELRHGASKSAYPDRNLVALAKFCTTVQVLGFDRPAAIAYGDVRCALERKGTSIGPLDLLIAAHALSISATLVSNNQREFRRVAGLKLANWL
jgi:tRNA(fMet)-specific endonuclease VapC